jgi:hypothetical protein
MFRCKTVEFLFDALPIGAGRAFLLRMHIDACPSCRKRILSLEESKALLVPPLASDAWAGLRRRLQSQVENTALGQTPAGQGRYAKFLRWATSAAMLCVLVAAGFWLFREPANKAPIAGRIRPSDRFELEYIRVGGQPAGAYIYQPEGNDIIIVWAEKTP